MSTRVLRSRKRAEPEPDTTTIVPSAAARKKPPKAGGKKAKLTAKNDENSPPKKRGKSAAAKTDEEILAKPKTARGKTAAKKDEEKPVKPKTARVKKVKADDGKKAPAKEDKVVNKTKVAKKKVETKCDGVIKSVQFKGRVPVDSECSKEINIDDYQVCIIHNEVFDAMLNQTNIGGNNNKYYMLQILQHKHQKATYKVWFRWGRVGKIAGTKLTHVSSFDEARKVFEKKFTDKTKNDWEMREYFEKYPNKYELIHVDYGDDNQQHGDIEVEEQVDVPQSKLATEIQALIKLIFDVKEFNQIVKEMKFDPHRSPLGKLTSQQIEAGYEALSLIESIIKKKCKGNLVQACNDFYTRIPHDFGMKVPTVIRSVEEIKEKVDLLEALGDIKIAMKMIKESMGEGNPLDSQYLSLDCPLAPLNRTSSEFVMVQKYVNNTHGSTHNSYRLNVANVFSVSKTNNNYRSDLKNRYLLWHGSRLSNWCGILKQGLRIAPPEAPVTGYMFGKGIYFADMVSKSANYCYSSKRQPSGLLLLCEVALGEWQEKHTADYRADLLREGTHSTKGVGKTHPNPKESISMEDGVVVPLGKPLSNSSLNTSLLYNEYVVYNVNQVKPRYLVQLDFNFQSSLW